MAAHSHTRTARSHPPASFEGWPPNTYDVAMGKTRKAQAEAKRGQHIRLGFLLLFDGRRLGVGDIWLSSWGWFP